MTGQVVAYKIDYRDEASEILRRLESSVTVPAALNADLGRRLANDLREHFLQRNLEGPRNQFNAPSSNFWADIRDAVNDAEVTADGASVTIAHPAIAQKVYGGTITADGGYLSIPARLEAYGKSPRLFENLTAIFFKSGAAALISTDISLTRADGSEGKRERGKKYLGTLKESGLVFYWLVKSVDQKPDPNALPTKEKLEEGLADTAEKHFERIKRRTT
jgi:hypothetical protein